MFESKEDKIARRIKDYIKRKKLSDNIYIMLRNGRIINIDKYSDMVKRGEINSQDAYVYINRVRIHIKAFFYYPFLFRYYDSLDAYLSRLGFHYLYFAAPATGIKYIAHAVGYAVDDHEKYLAIEVSDLDTVIINTNLPKIVAEVLGKKLISGEREITYEEYEKMRDMLKSQRLFAGYNFEEAMVILYKYYDEGNQTLAKEVARIAMDYDRIFNPYRVCYETKTWDEVDCWKIKLD